MEQIKSLLKYRNEKKKMEPLKEFLSVWNYTGSNENKRKRILKIVLEFLKYLMKYIYTKRSMHNVVK